MQVRTLSGVLKKIYIYASVAQLVAQLTLNQWVEGSSPSWGTKILPLYDNGLVELTLNQRVLVRIQVVALKSISYLFSYGMSSSYVSSENHEV